MDNDEIVKDLLARIDGMSKEEFMQEWREYTAGMSKEEIEDLASLCL